LALTNITSKLLLIDPNILSDFDRRNLHRQFSVKKRAGGFGITDFRLTADALRLGSLVSALPRVVPLNLGTPGSPALPELNEVVNRLLLLPNLNPSAKLELQNLILINNRQVSLPHGNVAEGLSKRLTAYIHKLQASTWEESLQLETPREHEILRSVTQPESGLVLSADPRLFPVKDEHFIFHAKRRLLGQKIMHDSDQLCHLCNQPLGPDMEHIMCCKYIGKNTLHHAVVARTATASRKTLTQSSVSVEVEPSLKAFVRPGRNVENPRSDIKLRNHITNKTIHVDFRMQTIKVEATADTPSVKIGEVQKLNYYETNYDLATAGVELVAAVIDSRGRWGKQLQEWVQKVARMGMANKVQYAHKVYLLRTSIAVAHTNALGKLISDFLRNQT